MGVFELLAISSSLCLLIVKQPVYCMMGYKKGKNGIISSPGYVSVVM